MRLTHRDKYGRWCSDGSKASLQLGYEDYPSILRGDAVDKLAAYEDTGLEPEAVDNLRLSLCGAVAAEIAEEQGYVEVNRAKEIAHAEAEGRLVILPCKVGDTIYAPTRNRISEFRVSQFDFGGYKKPYLWVEWYLAKGNTGNFLIDGISASEIGKTVFLTLEEAEAAMNGGKDDGD